MAWLDSAWDYRKAITVSNNSGGTLTDYQTKVTIDTSSLISASKMQSDGDDIRITTSDGTTLRDFWLDPQTINTTTTEVWFKVPSLPTGDTTFYIYYGNPAAAVASSITNTFVYGDDFSTNTAGNYTTSGGSVTVNTTNKEMTLAQQASGNTSAVPTSQTNPSSYIVEAYVSIASLATTSLAGLLGYKSTNTGGDGYVAQFGDKGSNDEVGVERYQQAHLTYTSISPSINTFYKLKGTFVSGTITARWNDATQQASSDSTYTSGKYGMRTYNVEAKYKYFRVREYTATEPTSALGSEETEGTAHTKTVNETVTTADSIVRAITKIIDDSRSVSDSIIKAVTRIFSDTQTNTDSISSVQGKGKEFSETITLVEAIQKTGTRIFTETSVTISETISFIVHYVKTFSDTVGNSEILSKTRGFILSEAVQTTERYRMFLNGVSLKWRKVIKTTVGWTKTAKTAVSWTKVTHTLTDWTKVGKRRGT